MRPIWCFVVLWCGAVALTTADKTANVEYSPPRPADPAGATYVIPITRRTLDRPADTTLLALAIANATPKPTINLQQQQQRQRQRQQPLKSDIKKAQEPSSPIFPGGMLPPRGQDSTKQEKKAADRVAASKPSAPRTTNEGVSKVELSFDGMDAYTTRYLVDNNNRVNEDPAFPGLAVGHGFVLETALSTLRVYSQKNGSALMPAVSLSTFFELGVQYNRSSGERGRTTLETTPTSWYDKHTERWFVAIVTVNRLWNDTGGVLQGTDIHVAVSDGCDPRGTWAFYRLKGSNDGTGGTPNFNCVGTCVQNLPRLAVWKDAVIIVTEEYGLANPNIYLYGSNVYAIDKHALVQGATAATTALVRTVKAPNGFAALVGLYPASQSGPCHSHNTFLVATPAGQAFGNVEKTLQLFSLTGTETLASQDPQVRLDWVQREVALDTILGYTKPPLATQKPGDNPFGMADGFANNNGTFFPPPLIDSFFANIASLVFVHDHLYCSWSTALDVEGHIVAGVAWAKLDPLSPSKVEKDGTLGLGGNNHLIYPHLAVRGDGRGVLAVSLSGPDYYPSAAYALLQGGQLGHLSIVGEGKGVVDGYTGYPTYGRTPARNAFGFAAALVDDTGAFWIDSEYVAHSCTLNEWLAGLPSPTCNGTRSYAANWNTRITKLSLFGDHSPKW